MISESIAKRTALEQIQTQTKAFAVALAMAVVFCIIFTGGYFGSRKGHCDIIIDTKINPNTASVGSLVRLSGIGPKRAEAIVEYRRSLSSGVAAFEKADDLQKISGIGSKTVENIQPFLKFR